MLEAKPDAKGAWEIGWGHDIPPSPGLTWTQAQADAQFEADLALATDRAAGDLGAQVWATLDPVRQAALTDMAYELGGKGLAAFRDMLTAIEAGDWKEAQHQGLTSAWAKEVPSRAQMDTQLLLTGQWPQEDKHMAEDTKTTQPTINIAHVTAAGSVGIVLTNALADAYQWLFTWPIVHPTHQVAHSLAVLTLSVLGGGGAAVFRDKLKLSTPAAPPVILQPKA